MLDKHAFFLLDWSRLKNATWETPVLGFLALPHVEKVLWAPPSERVSCNSPGWSANGSTGLLVKGTVKWLLYDLCWVLLRVSGWGWGWRMSWAESREVNAHNSVGRGVRTHLTPMRSAMSMEQIGSAIIRSYFCIRMADMMTPTLPNVSATMWRKTPAMKKSHCG